jgi:hypothetical protein
VIAEKRKNSRLSFEFFNRIARLSFLNSCKESVVFGACVNFVKIKMIVVSADVLKRREHAWVQIFVSFELVE